MEKRGAPIADFWGKPLQDLLQLLEATPAGLTTVEAKRRLVVHGPNSLARESRFVGLVTFFRAGDSLVPESPLIKAIGVCAGDPTLEKPLDVAYVQNDGALQLFALDNADRLVRLR